MKEEGLGHRVFHKYASSCGGANDKQLSIRTRALPYRRR